MTNLLESSLAENLTYWISVGAIVLLAVTLLTISLKTRKLDTQTIVFASLCIALSTTLSFFKFSIVTYGGSITLAAMVPVIIFAYAKGAGPGLLCGVIYGLLQFITGPYILTPVTFILDYILAFGAIGLAGIAGKNKNPGKGILLGATFAYLGRFLMAFISGIIYYNLNAIWADLPQDFAAQYSFIYQVYYLVPDFIIAVIVLFTLAKTGLLEKLLNLVNKQKQQSIE